MPHITRLDLSSVLRSGRYSDVFKAIATNMTQLNWLNISDSNVEQRAIEHLLPIEEIGQRGCPELTFLGMIRCNVGGSNYDSLFARTVAYPVQVAYWNQRGHSPLRIQCPMSNLTSGPETWPWGPVGW